MRINFVGVISVAIEEMISNIVCVLPVETMLS